MSELKHFGVLGMRWGVRRNATIAGAARGRAVALKKEGHTKEAAAANRSADVHSAKAKNIQRKLDNYTKFQKELKALEKTGKTNDMDAVLAVAKRYDTREAKRKADYKKAPKFTLKEKLYRATLGDPSIPKGERVAVSALAIIGTVSYMYMMQKAMG